MALGFPSLCSAASSGVDVGSKSARASFSFDRRHDLGPARIGFFTVHDWVRLALGVRRPDEPHTLYSAALSIGLDDGAAKTGRAAFARIRREDNFHIHSRASTLDGAELLRAR